MENDFEAFFSNGLYISWPPRKKRVSLFYKGKKEFNNSIQLYKPSSKKANLLKTILVEVVRIFPFIIRILSEKKKEGEFIKFFKQTYSVDVYSSIYYPTVTDKIVLQLISNGEIYGYIKIGLNESGNLKVLNEQKAIELFSDSLNQLNANYLIDSGEFNKSKFIVLKNLKGNNGFLDPKELEEIIKSFKKEEKKIKLCNHSQINKLLEKTNNRDYQEYNLTLKKVVLSSLKKYNMVFEHGDLAPWNLIRSEDNKITIYDLEYFKENGIEYLDEINYHFQIGKLINKFDIDSLILDIKIKTAIEEFEVFMIIFLIKKIITLDEEGSNNLFEKEMLSTIIKIYKG